MGNKVTFTPGFCLLSALGLLVLPLRWAFGSVLAALVHELAHCLAVWLCGGQILSVTLGGHGAVMEASPMTSGKEAVCALAGPVGSLSVLLIGKYFPEAAICALAQGIYNLLPFYPLDGGRVLRALFSRHVCCAVEVFFCVFLPGFLLWIGTQNGEIGMMMLLILSFAFIRGKITCKEPQLAVQ